MLEAQEYPDMGDLNMKTLPKIGYIALIDKQPVAAAFLRKVEGGIVAQVDGLTSNPYFGSIIRHIGINKVLTGIIEDAKDLKLKGLICFCQDLPTIKRAEATGFTLIQHSSILSMTFKE